MCISEPTSGPRAVAVCRSACLTRSGVEQHHRNAGSGGQRMAAGCTFASRVKLKEQDCLIFHCCYLKRCLEDAETPPVAHNSFGWFALTHIEVFGYVREPLACVHEWMQHCMHVHESFLHLPPGPDVGNSVDLWPSSCCCETAVNALNLCKI